MQFLWHPRVKIINLCSEMQGFPFSHGATALVAQGLLIIEDSWSHSDTPHSVGRLWTRDQPDAETST